MAEGNQTGATAGLLLVLFVFMIGALLGAVAVKALYMDTCEEQCLPYAMISMDPGTGCICAEASK